MFATINVAIPSSEEEKLIEENTFYLPKAQASRKFSDKGWLKTW